MTSSLDVSSSSCDSGGVTANDELACFATLTIQLVQADPTANRNRASKILAANFERLRERYIPEVMCPEKKRTLCRGSSEEVVSRGFDGDFQVMLHSELHAGLKVGWC